jgi:NitT/TauT family transport system substrate-binding protein
METKHCKVIAAIVIAATVAFGYGSARAAEALKKVVIAYSSIAPHQAPAWVGLDAGIYRRNGLDVQLIYVESGSRTIQTLVSGDVVAAQSAGPAAIQSNLQGSGVVLVAGILNTLDYKFMVAREITRPDQLKGKAVAVSRVGSSSDFATRYALEKYGLVPDKDVSILQIGSQPARFAALEAGKIHGIMVSIPVTARAAKAGFNTLADLQMLGLEYQHTALAVSQNLIKTQPDLVRAIVKSTVESVHYMKTHRRETIAILAKYLKTDDPDALQEAYDAEVMAMFPQKPYPTTKGIQTILREFGAKDAAARAARPEQFVDLTFIKELDSSGFIDRLYKSQPQTVAKATPAPEPAPAPVQVPAKEKPAQLDTKAKPAAVEEKAKAVVKTTAAAGEKAPAMAKSSATQEYVVQLGDTLSRLSERYYNSVNKWEKIYEANKDTLKNPNYIYIGMKLVIPPDA